MLSDLLRPDGAFAGYAPDGLRRLIDLRLDREAKGSSLAPEALAEAFERALRELTGADRPPRTHNGPSKPEEPGETVEDL